MRKRTRLILLITLLLFIGTGLGAYHAATRFLPGFVRRKIVDGLTEATRRRVTCDTVRLELWKGIVIRNLRVYDKTRTEETVLCVDEASAAFILLPWGKERKLLIPSVQLYGARLNLVRGKDGILNIQDIIDRPGRPAAPAVRPILKNLRITDSELVFVDEGGDTPSTTMVRLFEGKARASWNKVFIDAAAEVSFNDSTVSLACHGNYAYKEKRWDVRLTGAGIDPKPFLAYLPALPFTWKDGVIRQLKVDTTVKEDTVVLKSKLTLDGVAAVKEGIDLDDGLAHIEATYEAPRDKWREGRIQGRCRVEGAAFHVSDPFKTDGRLKDFQGAFAWQDENLSAVLTGTAATAEVVLGDVVLSDVRADIQTRIARTPSADGPPAPPTFTATAQVRVARAAGLARVNTAQEIAAQVIYEDGAFLFSQGRARVLNHDIAAEGEIRGEALEVSVTGTFPLADVTRFLSAETPWPDHEISGTAQAVITLHRTLAAGEKTQIAGEAAINDIWLKLNKYDKTFSAETGRIQFDIPSQTVSWDFSDISYDGASYASSGTLTDFRMPHIVLELEGPHLSLRADAVRRADVVAFKACSGRWHNSAFQFTGTWEKTGEIVDIEAEALLELANLELLPEAAPPVLKKIAGKGPCRVTARLKGPLKTPALWTLEARATSDAVRLAGYYIEDIFLEYEQLERRGFIRNATFTAYEGTGLIKGRLDFTKEVPAFALRAALDNLNLEKLKGDTPLRGRTFFGILSMNVSAQGTIDDPDSITGGGRFSIKNGNVWEFNPLRGLGSFLFIPRFTNIVFKDAQGDYFIREGHIETDNLELIGPKLGLLIEGKMSLKGELDFLVNTQIPLGPAGRIKEIAQSVQTITKAGSLTAIRVTGTVEEPKYKLRPVGANIVKKFTDLFSNIVP